jgi:hypothetical protein
MTTDRDLERLLDTWLADGPTLVADRVIDGMADRIGRQGQRPAWRLHEWRFPVMPVIIRVVLVAAVLAIIAGGGAILIGSRLQSTPPQPSLPTEGPHVTPLPALSSTFTSTLYGESFRTPPWDNVHNATRPAGSGAGPEEIDEVSPDDYASGFSVTAFRLAPGQTAESWFQSIVDNQVPNSNGQVCVPPQSTWRETSVNGVAGFTYDTPCNFHEIELVTKGRGYQLAFSAPDYVFSAQDEAMYRAILDTVTFADTAPIDTP